MKKESTVRKLPVFSFSQIADREPTLANHRESEIDVSRMVFTKVVQLLLSA